MNKSYQERLNIVLTYIENHLDENISLKKLAKIAYFSPYHFHRIFFGMMKETLMSYVKRLKLQKAAKMLINTNMSVTDIAFDLGYESLEVLRKAMAFHLCNTVNHLKIEVIYLK